MRTGKRRAARSIGTRCWREAASSACFPPHSSRGRRALPDRRVFRRAFPNARWEIDVIFGKDDLVARQQTFTATHEGEYLGVEPTGQDVRASEAGIVRFAGGRMVEFWGVFDDAGLLRQLTEHALV